jgi:hypothetical protein
VSNGNMRTKQDYLLCIPFEYIIGFSRESGLIRGYSCFTKKVFVHRLLMNLTVFECRQLYEDYKNGANYELSVERFMRKFPTGEIVGKNFVEHLRREQDDSGIIYFEFPVLKTRVDILTLKKDFHAYEVKSIRDRLDRLNYQVPALKEFFEYVSLIVPHEAKQRIIEMVDGEIGIITFTAKHNELIFEIEREPKCLDCFNESIQLEILQKRELRAICAEALKFNPKKKNRKELINLITEHCPRQEINEIFKTKIRDREKTRKVHDMHCASLARYF